MKRFIRSLIRTVFLRVRVRGRHRVSDIVGPWLAPKGIEVIDLGGIPFPVDHSISPYRHVFYGLYEEDNVDLLRSLINQGDICIDAGANIGYITSVLSASAGPDGRVFAFEPSRSCLARLGFLESVSNVELLPDAIGACEGTAEFYDTERAVTKGYAFLADLRDDPGDAIRYDVRLRSLDAFSLQRGLTRVRVLKLDIEGAELAALEGAANLLARHAIDYILLEHSFGDYAEERQRDSDIRSLLASHCYRLVAAHGRDSFWKSPEAS